MRRVILVATIALAACGRHSAPVVDGDAVAAAAAERKAVGDVDAARRDAQVPAAEQNPAVPG